jgi:endoglucanase
LPATVRLRSDPHASNSAVGWARFGRRRFIEMTGAGLTTFAFTCASSPNSAVSPTQLPLWRGFNLSEMFDTAAGLQQFQQFDFDTISEWGFNFVRLPCSYRFWASPDPARWLTIDDVVLSQTIDMAITMARAREIHVNLCLHRAPGYCVNPPAEALNIWVDEQALEAAAHHWTHLTERYRGVPSADLSFNLLNEPPDTISVDQYLRVHRRLHAAVKAVDPDRLVIVDGMNFATAPVPELASEGVAISMHAYSPFELSHFRASWIGGSESWPTPTWPLEIRRTGQDGALAVDRWDRARLQSEEIVPFRRPQAQRIGVHVGEWGAYQYTPHDVTLRWMSDRLSLWRKAGWGWALWNLRGGFGVLDSGRSDVAYENFRGHLLDRKMLELLRSG